VTDEKDNLGELFRSGGEVVAYRSADDAIDKIRHYMQHPDQAAAIARAGQQRTLSEHTYRHRMQELSDILGRYLRRTR